MPATAAPRPLGQAVYSMAANPQTKRSFWASDWSEHPHSHGSKRAPWAACYDQTGTPLPGVPGGRHMLYPPPRHWGKQRELEPCVKWPGASSPPVKRMSIHEPLDMPAEFIPVHAVYDDTEKPAPPVLPPGGEFNDLTFESRFESGNLARAVRTGKYEYNLVLRPDITSGNCQWYNPPSLPAHTERKDPVSYFETMHGQVLLPSRQHEIRSHLPFQHRQLLQREVSIPAGALGPPLFSVCSAVTSFQFAWPRITVERALNRPPSAQGQRPLMWSEKDTEVTGIGWRRVGEKVLPPKKSPGTKGLANASGLHHSRTRPQVCYFENGTRRRSGANHYTLSFELSFPHADDCCFLAACFPYTYSQLCEDIASLCNEQPKIVSRSTLCTTLSGNDCHLLTITSPAPQAQPPPPPSPNVQPCIPQAAVLLGRIYFPGPFSERPFLRAGNDRRAQGVCHLGEVSAYPWQMSLPAGGDSPSIAH